LHLERDEQTGLADLGLRLAEATQPLAAIQAEIVPVQVTVAGDHIDGRPIEIRRCADIDVGARM